MGKAAAGGAPLHQHNVLRYRCSAEGEMGGRCQSGSRAGAIDLGEPLLLAGAAGAAANPVADDRGWPWQPGCRGACWRTVSVPGGTPETRTSSMTAAKVMSTSAETIGAGPRDWAFCAAGRGVCRLRACHSAEFCVDRVEVRGAGGAIAVGGELGQLEVQRGCHGWVTLKDGSGGVRVCRPGHGLNGVYDGRGGLIGMVADEPAGELGALEPRRRGGGRSFGETHRQGLIGQFAEAPGPAGAEHAPGGQGCHPGRGARPGRRRRGCKRLAGLDWRRPAERIAAKVSGAMVRPTGGFGDRLQPVDGAQDTAIHRGVEDKEGQRRG